MSEALNYVTSRPNITPNSSYPNLILVFTAFSLSINETYQHDAPSQKKPVKTTSGATITALHVIAK